MEQLHLAIQVIVEHRQAPVRVRGLTLKVVTLVTQILIAVSVTRWVHLQEYDLDLVEEHARGRFLEVHCVRTHSRHL